MDLPELSSADLEALFKPLSDQGAYQELEQTAAWLLDPSPVGSNDPPLYGAAAPSLSPTGVAGVPADLLFSDAFLDGLPGLFPLPDLASDSFAPPGYPTADSSGGGSGSGSAGGGGRGAAAFAAAGVPAAAVTSVPAGKAKGGKKELTEEQKERIKAKNRRAQNRYREKQKAKAAGAEAEYSNTATELQRLRLENTRLQERQATMQQVLAVREEFVSSLEGGKAASDQEAAPPAALPCSSGNSASTAQQAACALALCHSSGSGGSDASGSSGGSGGASSSHGLDESGGQCCPLTGLTLSQIAELKQTPPEALQRSWRSIAQRLTSTMQQLDAAEGSPDSTLAARSEQLQQEVHSILREGQSFCFEHAVYQPTNVQRLFAAALDDGRSQISAEDMGKWGEVAAALQLSEVQLGRLASARSQFVRSIGEVCAERRQIFERLQALTEEVPTSLRALQHVTATWLKVHEATADLTANMNQEHCVCMSFVRDAFGFTLSPRQKALAIVRSFPFFPDMYSVSTAALEAQHPAQLAAPQPAGLLTAAAASQ